MIDGQLTTERIEQFGKKRDVATLLKVLVRSVDNYLALEMPVIKLSPRCCPFDIPEVRDWFKSRYGQQSRKN